MEESGRMTGEPSAKEDARLQGEVALLVKSVFVFFTGNSHRVRNVIKKGKTLLTKAIIGLTIEFEL
jgi:hypothetical protein